MVLAIAMLIPIVTLYGMVRQSKTEISQFANRERHGVTYTRALVAVELALAESQTSELLGRSVSTERLTRAIDHVATIDVRHGGELRTRERWAELRAKIEALLKGKETDPKASFEAYEETIDLLMTLLDKVRLTSGLIRDPYVDTYHLQDAAGQELPEAILRSSLLVSSAVLTSRMRPSEQSGPLVSLLKVGDQVVGNTGDISDDVRQTVDVTKSRTLGGSLLPPLDRYRMAVESLVPAATAKQGSTIAIELGKVQQTWKQMLGASSGLSTMLLDQLDGLLSARLDDVSTDLTIAITVLALAIVLAFTPPVTALIRARRRRTVRSVAAGSRPERDLATATAGELPPGRPNPQLPPSLPAGRPGGGPAGTTGPAGGPGIPTGPAPSAPGASAGPYPAPVALPAGGDQESISYWERSGAPR